MVSGRERKDKIERKMELSEKLEEKDERKKGN